MSGASDPATAAKRLLATGSKTVVVKCGRQGCTIATGQGIIHVPGFPAATVVDTTGAGDAFCGGFLAATLAGAPLVHAARMGHAAAVYVIGQLGGHTGAPTLAQVEQLMHSS
jgi:ribokinase